MKCNGDCLNCIYSVCICDSADRTHAERQKRYRQRVKLDPQKVKALRDYHKEYMRKRRRQNDDKQ